MVILFQLSLQWSLISGTCAMSNPVRYKDHFRGIAWVTFREQICVRQQITPGIYFPEHFDF